MSHLGESSLNKVGEIDCMNGCHILYLAMGMMLSRFLKQIILNIVSNYSEYAKHTWLKQQDVPKLNFFFVVMCFQQKKAATQLDERD